MSDFKAQKHPLQAVVLADSFTRTFRPMTLEKPKVLMPVAGTPMIEYSLEMLANAKVKEIIVVSCWHAQQVRDYLEKSRWQGSRSPVVRVVSFPLAQSAGEALRELAGTRTVMSDPFVLMSGDVVSNVRLIPIIKLHEQNPDKSKVMTSLFKRVDNSLQVRNFDDNLILAMNAQTKQIIMYETASEGGELDEENHAEHSIVIPATFEKHPKLEIRSDLRDCHIDICSPQCLDLITDEFHDDLRLDFVCKEVKRGEAFGHTFYCHELVEDYATRVHALRDYAEVSKDVLNRWVYPLVPDNNWNDPTNGTCWFAHSSWLYREHGVQVDRSAVLGRRTMVGKNTRIGAGVSITNSVIGQNVTIGAGAVIKDSYIWDGVVVESGVCMDRSLVCDDAVIGQDSKLERGSVVSYKVKLKPNTVVAAFTRLTISERFAEDYDESEDEGNDNAGAALTPPPGQIRPFVIEEEPDFTIPQIPKWVTDTLSKSTLLMGDKSPYTVMGSMGCDELEQYNRTWDDFNSVRRSSMDSAMNGGGANAEEESLAVVVTQLVVGMISRKAEELDDSYYSSLAMELKGLRASRVSCTFEEIAAVTFAVLLCNGLYNDFKPQTPEEMKARLVDLISLIAPLLVKFTQDIMNKQTSIQLALLKAAELVFLVGPMKLPAAEILLELPDIDYLVEESIYWVDALDFEITIKDATKFRGLFAACVYLLGGEEVLDVEALVQYRDSREEMDPELVLRELYVSQKRTIESIIQRWQKEEEEESEEDEEGSSSEEESSSEESSSEEESE